MEYFAPEMVSEVLHEGYNKAVDNWALGVLIYEMVSGSTPFFTKDAPEDFLLQRISSGVFRFPR